MKRYTFVLNFGFAETACLSYLPFSCDIEFENEVDALKDLAEYLKQAYINVMVYNASACCIDFKKIDTTAHYCRTCGRSLKHDFNGEDFANWLLSMRGIDDHTYNCDFVEWEPDRLWVPGVLFHQQYERTHVVLFGAEWIIASALGYEHKKGRSFNDVFLTRDNVGAAIIYHY